MKTLQDNIDIMQALIDGKTIQAKFRTGQTWDDILKRNWSLFNFANYEYRIKPERPPLGPVPLFIRIEKNWPDKIVKLLKLGELDEDQERLFLIMYDICGVRSAHV